MCSAVYIYKILPTRNVNFLTHYYRQISCDGDDKEAEEKPEKNFLLEVSEQHELFDLFPPVLTSV